MRNEVITLKQAKSLESTLSRLLKLGDIEALAKETGFVKRVRRVRPLELLSSLIVCCGGADIKWLSQVHRSYASFSGEMIQYKPFHNQLRKEGFSMWLIAVIELLMNFFVKSELVPNSKKLQEFEDIIIHDGSSVSLKDSLASEYPGRFTKNAPAAVEIHTTLSLYGCSVNQISIAADKEAETHFRPSPQDLRGKLLLADRGYQDRQYFQEILENGGSYIVRGKTNIKPIVSKAYDERGRRQKRLEGKILDLTKLKGKHYDFEIYWEYPDGTRFEERLAVLYKQDGSPKKRAPQQNLWVKIINS
jgi:hypothetical protein